MNNTIWLSNDQVVRNALRTKQGYISALQTLCEAEERGVRCTCQAMQVITDEFPLAPLPANTSGKIIRQPGGLLVMPSPQGQGQGRKAGKVSVGRTLINAGGAVVRAVKSLVKQKPLLRSNEEQARCLAICAACEFYDVKRKRCAKCNCFARFKTRLATEHCPLNPPKW